MKQILVCMFCLALLICTGCKKDEKETIALSAKIEAVGGLQKVHMENTLPAWDPNDQVWVNGKACSVEISGSGSSRFATILGADKASTYRAVYPASLLSGNPDLSTSATVNVRLPREQIYETNNGVQTVRLPMAALSSTDELYFKNLCSVLKITVTNPAGKDPLELKDIVVKTPGALLSGSGSVTVDGTEQAIQLTSGTDSVILKGINTTIAAGANQTYYVVVPTFSNKEMQFRLVVSEGRYAKKKTAENKTLSRNKLVSVGFSADKIEDDDPTIVVGGYFSVSPTEKVRFSRGNLWYDRNNGTYHFEDDQTSLGSIDNTQIYYVNHLSYFNWSKTESVARTLPYSDSYTTNDHLFTNDPLIANRPKADFTVEGATGKFRALTKDEMNYMLYTRNNAANLQATKYINGTFGLLLLPDDCPVSVSAVSTKEDLTTYGAVFMPASGGVAQSGSDAASTTKSYDVNKSGGYWLSSASHISEHGLQCWNLYFVSGGTGTSNSGTAQTMRSIRLVCR